jgi:ATP-dependent Clp protease ATP-binding subunit ClpC
LGFNLQRDAAFEEALAYEEMRKKLLESLKRVFRPEFINRLDGVIVFRALNPEDIRQIVKLELDKVSRRLEDYAIALDATDPALDQLATEGFDPDMGARPLRRIIQQKVEDRLSDALLGKEFEEGDRILVDVDEDNQILLRRDQTAPAESEEELGINA